MFSSPKGGSTKAILSGCVDSTFGSMSSAEYSEKVNRASESYEYRQKELTEYRKTHKRKNSHKANKQRKLSFFERISIFFRQIGLSQQLRSK